MKILFTANRFPYPPFRGDKLKIYHLAKILSQKHELHLLTFLQKHSDREYLPELQKYFKEIHLVPLSKVQSGIHTLTGLFSKKPFQVHFFKSAEMTRQVKLLYQKGNFDVIHVQHLRMAPYWAQYQDIPRILDLPDAYSLYWKRRAQALSGPAGWFARAEQKRVYQFEKSFVNYEQTLVCSREDAQYLRSEHGLNNVAVLPNGVDTQNFRDQTHDYQLNQTILFTGNMDYAPNVDAVQYFAKEIFPEIRRILPQTRFVIAGQRPVRKVLDLASSDIEITGFIPNLKDVYRKAALVVAPLRFGAGTQNKVLEGMAMGVPVVTAKVGFEGLNIQSGEGAFLALNTRAFTDTCIQLLQSAALRKSTGEKGKSIIQGNFSWEAVSSKLEGYFKQVIAEKLD